MENIAKIKKMEEILDRHNELLDELDGILNEFVEHQEDYQELKEYYLSELFLQDMKKADAGGFPADLKCGVLTEDAVFDTMGDNYHMAIRMLEIATNIIKEH